MTGRRNYKFLILHCDMKIMHSTIFRSLKTFYCQKYEFLFQRDIHEQLNKYKSVLEYCLKCRILFLPVLCRGNLKFLANGFVIFRG